MGEGSNTQGEKPKKKTWSRDSSNRIAWTEFRDVCKKVPEHGEWFVPILGCPGNLVNGY